MDNVALEERFSYKIRVKNCPEWKDRNVCSVEISVGNENQEGDKLRSLLEWVNENFDSCIINVADTLQRHNAIGEGMPKGMATFHTLVEGAKYIARNADSFAALKIPHQIIRWNEWLNHPDFEKTHYNIQAYYLNNPVFAELVNQDARTFLTRNDKDTERHFMTSVDFILEEAAAHILMARNHSPVCVYPGKRLQSLDYIASATVPDEIAGLNNSIYARIVLDRRGNGNIVEAQRLNRLNNLHSTAAIIKTPNFQP